MADVFLKGAVWQKFTQLESEFISAIHYFPLEKSFSQIWSKFFGDLLVRIGNSVDSLFRLMIKDESFDSYPHVKDLKATRRSRNINFFRDFFEPIYELSGVDVKIAYEHVVYDEQSYPFEEFKNGENPGW
ncbi:MAG: hypothetical protein JSV05_09410 [Candidatus Bathyarchaeota archaeon]|nr:MAG: hypothetical protein JSV05_09410 [Candidatus Bathyarchaeota archaeon]